MCRKGHLSWTQLTIERMKTRAVIIKATNRMFTRALIANTTPEADSEMRDSTRIKMKNLPASA